MNIIVAHVVIALTYATLSSYAWSPKNIRGESMPASRRGQSPSKEFPMMRMISEQQLGTFETIETQQPSSERKVSLHDFTSEVTPSSLSPSMLIDFETAWEIQRKILDGQLERLALSKSNAKNSFEHSNLSSFLPTIDNNIKTEHYGNHDTVIMLQHHPVYTLGTGSDEKFVKSFSSDDNGDDNCIDPSLPRVPVIRMDRGGEVTYHGPGQITVYPILDLRSYRQDIHWYMRALEEAIILAISKCSRSDKTLRAEREDGVTGVWIDDHKGMYLSVL